MATKQEVMNYLLQTYQMEQVGDNTYKAVFNVGDKGRSQLVFILGTDLGFVFSSPFADEDDLTPALAFKIADESFLGVKKIGSMYSVVHFVPIENADENELQFGMEMVVNLADKLEALVGGDRF